MAVQFCLNILVVNQGWDFEHTAGGLNGECMCCRLNMNILLTDISAVSSSATSSHSVGAPAFSRGGDCCIEAVVSIGQLEIVDHARAYPRPRTRLYPYQLVRFD